MGAASGGPCYYGHFVDGTNPYEPLFQRLRELDPDHTLFALKAQNYLWTTNVSGEWGAVAGISAMPSLHVALATLFAILAWQCQRWLGALLTVFAVATQIGSVVLGWHYAVDGYAGALLAYGCWISAGALLRRFPIAEQASL